MPSDDFNNGFFGKSDGFGTYDHFQGRVARDRLYGINETGQNPQPQSTNNKIQNSTANGQYSYTGPAYGSREIEIWLVIISLGGLALGIAFVYFVNYGNLPTLGQVITWELVILLALGAIIGGGIVLFKKFLR